MGAYSLPNPKPTCQVCSGTATEKVYNTFNAFVGDFCSKHAREKVKELDEAHARNPHDGRVHL